MKGTEQEGRSRSDAGQAVQSHVFLGILSPVDRLLGAGMFKIKLPPFRSGPFPGERTPWLMKTPLLMMLRISSHQRMMAVDR